MQEYDDGRIWFKQKGKVVTVGLTEKALEEIGSIQSVSLPVEGDECVQDDAVGEVEGVKATFEIIAPLDGTISSINDSLNEDMEVLANDLSTKAGFIRSGSPKAKRATRVKSERQASATSHSGALKKLRAL